MRRQLVWWQSVVFFWAAAGIGGVITAKLAIRASGSHDPLSLNDDPPVTVALGLLLILAGPILPLFMVGLCAQTISQGRLPVSNRAWWPAWASKFPVPDAQAPEAVGLSEDHSPETLLCRMIELRRQKDPRLRDREVPDHWPMFVLWQTTEAVILEMVEQYFWLCNGGLTPREALGEIEARGFKAASFTAVVAGTLRSHIADRLASEDPALITLGPDLLDEIVRVAERWAKGEIERNEADRPFPPPEWLEERVTPSKFETDWKLPVDDGGLTMMADGNAGRPYRLRSESDWWRLKLRIVPGDELWTFRSPPETWKGLAGRTGAALIRNGRPIGHVTTMMN